MDAVSAQEWFKVLGPYVLAISGAALAVWQAKRTERRVDGRMDQLEEHWKADGDARVAAVRAEILQPSRVAEAAALVKSDAKDARDAAKP